MPSIPCTTIEELNKLLKKVNTKKAPGFDKISPKQVKLAVRVLAEALSKAINSRKLFLMKQRLP